MLPPKKLGPKEEWQFVPGQMLHNILMGEDRLIHNLGWDRLTQKTLDSESNLISKSWDQDKYCVDKCPHDSCHLLQMVP